MMHTTDALYTQLHMAHIELDRQISSVRDRILMQQPDNQAVDPNVFYRAQYPDGKFMLSELLAAKAQLLSGMAALKAADVSSKAQQRPRR